MKHISCVILLASVVAAGLFNPAAAQPVPDTAAGESRTLDLDALRNAAKMEVERVEPEPVAEPCHHHQQPTCELETGTTMKFVVMQVCLLAIVLILHTYTGMHIIRRGIIFCDLVLDQLAAFGVVAAVGLGIKYGTVGSYLLSSVAVLLGCILLAVIKPKRQTIPREAVIGIMYGMALVASLLLADRLAEGGTYLRRTLVGSMLWVSWPLIGITAGAYALLLLFHYRFRHVMIGITDGRPQPRNTMWDFLFFISQGIITILIVPVAGVLLAYGFLMIPAAIGILVTRRWGPGLALGWGAGMLACLLGLWVSYTTDSPYGPSLVVAMGTFFIVAVTIRAIASFKSPGGAS